MAASAGASRPNFLAQLFFLVFINLIIKPFYIFGIDLQVQNQVGQEAYGLYFALFNFGYLFQIVGDWGLYQYNNRQVALHSRSWLLRFLLPLLALKGLLALLLLVGGCALGWVLGWRGEQWEELVYMLLNQALLTLILFLRSNLSGLQYYRTDSTVSVADKLLLIGFCLPVLYRGGMDIYLFIRLQSLSLACTAVFAGLLLWRLRPAGRLSFCPEFRYGFALLRRTTPYALVVLLMSLYARLDVLLLVQWLPEGEGERQAGLYASGYRLLETASIFCFLFAGLLLPMFARLLRDAEGLRALLILSFRWMLLLTAGGAFLVFFFAQPLGLWFYDEYSPRLGQVLQILMLSFFAVGQIYIFGTLLTAAGRLQAMNRIFVLAIILNIALNAWAIPADGALGAAWVALFTQSFVALAECRLALRFLGLSPKPGQLMVGLLRLTGAALIAWAAARQPWLEWRVAFCLAGLGIVLWAVLSGWIKWTDRKGIGE